MWNTHQSIQWRENTGSCLSGRYITFANTEMGCWDWACNAGRSVNWAVCYKYMNHHVRYFKVHLIFDVFGSECSNTWWTVHKWSLLYWCECIIVRETEASETTKYQGNFCFLSGLCMWSSAFVRLCFILLIFVLLTVQPVALHSQVVIKINKVYRKNQ